MDECPVCLDDMVHPSIGGESCTHRVCASCFVSLRSLACPLCRAPWGAATDDGIGDPSDLERIRRALFLIRTRSSAEEAGAQGGDGRGGPAIAHEGRV